MLDVLRADDNGVWCHGGKPRRKYIVERDSDTSEVIKVLPVDEHLDSKVDDIFTLVRMYHHHKATPEFQRRISYVIDSSEQTVQYAVVQYLFDGGKEVPVVLLPHGNAKNTTTQYRRTQKSTLSRLKEVSGKPKDVVSLLYEEAGSVLEANSVSELPHDHRQVYNNQQSTGVDPLFELVQQCKVYLQPGGRKFIRSVTFETGNCCILSTDSQLVRFCTNQGASCVLGIDPIFNLGKFYMTVTTYVYSHVINKTTHTPRLSLVPFLFIQKRRTSLITISSLH